MKLSWKFKMVLLMLLAVVGSIAITWILNKTFLEDYYLHSKMDTLDKAYRVISEVIETAESQNTTDTNEDEQLTFSEDALLKLEILILIMEEDRVFL